jgi:hypothetical protein
VIISDEFLDTKDLYVHQIGPDQDGFLKFAKSEFFPQLGQPLHGSKKAFPRVGAKSP